MDCKIKLGISSCLLGEHVRYDGGHKYDQYLIDTLGKYVEWVPVCPEVECGLSVPREAMRLVGDPAAPRLVTISTGIDHTERMLKWAAKKVGELEKEDLCGVIFKGRSPSSGYKGVKVYPGSGMKECSGTALFTASFMKYFTLIPIEDDERLRDPKILDIFMERVFDFSRSLD